MFENEILSSKEYLSRLGIVVDKEVSLNEMRELVDKVNPDLWDFPLDETDEIRENDLNVVQVCFTDDVRYCEIPD